RPTRASPHTISSCFAYGTLTHSGHASQRVRLQPHNRAPLMLKRDGQPHNTAHATPARLTHTRFRLLRVRSPLLTESLLFSLPVGDRKSTRLNSSHVSISYAVFCLKKKNITRVTLRDPPQEPHCTMPDARTGATM